MPTKQQDTKVGDFVVVAAHRQGGSERLGEILELFGGAGQRHYRVRWDDGHESIFYPGSDAVIRPARRTTGKEER
jgi:hypothetical protein